MVRPLRWAGRERCSRILRAGAPARTAALLHALPAADGRAGDARRVDGPLRRTRRARVGL